jgi:universal stress protein A
VATEPDAVIFPESERGIEQTRAYLEEIVGRLGIRCDIRYPVSLVPEDVIVKESECFDLVVMTSHGREGIVRVLKGSVAEDVLRHAACPALIMNRHVLRAHKG